jgi:hypothetical protein
MKRLNESLARRLERIYHETTGNEEVPETADNDCSNVNVHE